MASAERGARTDSDDFQDTTVSGKEDILLIFTWPLVMVVVAGGSRRRGGAGTAQEARGRGEETGR